MYSVEHDVSNLIWRVDRCLSCLLDTHQLSADAKKIDIPAMLATRHSNCLRDIIDSVRQNDYTSVFADMAIGDVTESEILDVLSNTPGCGRFSEELKGYRDVVTRIIDITERGDYSSAFDLIKQNGIKGLYLEIYRDHRLSKQKVDGLRDFVGKCESIDRHNQSIQSITQSVVNGEYVHVFDMMASNNITPLEITTYLLKNSFDKSIMNTFEVEWKHREVILRQVLNFVSAKKYQEAMDFMKTNGVVFKEISKMLDNRGNFAAFLRTNKFDLG